MVKSKKIKKIGAALLVLTIISSCKTKNTVDPDTLPKDISLKPEHSVSQQQDSKFLQSLREEIDAMINTHSCTNTSDWRISPIGSKACGGPASYLAYPIAIEDEIIPKIQNYTNLQLDFNKKYGIISDCMMETPPSGINCENGKAILVYSSGI